MPHFSYDFIFYCQIVSTDNSCELEESMSGTSPVRGKVMHLSEYFPHSKLI